MKQPTTLPRLHVVPAGPVASSAEIAAGLAGAVLGVQAIILQGLIKSGVLDLGQWRRLFQASLDELPPAERQGAHACTWMVTPVGKINYGNTRYVLQVATALFQFDAWRYPGSRAVRCGSR
jgi:hypothetical protein